MSSYMELFRHFEKTRDLVRDLLICGFKRRGEFVRRSARTYDDERRRVESWLDGYVRHDDSVKGRQIAISVDCGRITEDPLYKAYGAKSFTDNDIRLHFLLLDLLADGEAQTLRELTEAMAVRYGFVFDEQTVRGKLREYVREGLILTEKRGRTAYFRLTPHDADDLLAACPGLDEALRSFSGSTPFGVVGDSILKSVGLRNDIFLRKHRYIVHTLEDIILPDILRAIEEGRTLLLCNAPQRVGHEAAEREETVVPMQILVSSQTGRRYLAAYVPKYRRFNSYRLDYLRAVTVGGTVEDAAALRETYRRVIGRVYGVSFGSREDTGAVEPIRITFRFDEEAEAFVVERLARERRGGVLTHPAKDTYVLTLDVDDPLEVLPWLRSFTGRIARVEGGCALFRKRFYEDARRMQVLYGGDGRADIQ